MGVGRQDLDRGCHGCSAFRPLRRRTGLRSSQEIFDSLRRPKLFNGGNVLSDSPGRHLGVEQHDATVDAALSQIEPRPALLTWHGHRHDPQQDPPLRRDEQLHGLCAPAGSEYAKWLQGPDAQRCLGVGRQHDDLDQSHLCRWHKRAESSSVSHPCLRSGSPEALRRGNLDVGLLRQ